MKKINQSVDGYENANGLMRGEKQKNKKTIFLDLAVVVILVFS